MPSGFVFQRSVNQVKVECDIYCWPLNKSYLYESVPQLTHTRRRMVLSHSAVVLDFCARGLRGQPVHTVKLASR